MMEDITINLFASKQEDEHGIERLNIGYTFLHKGVPYGTYIKIHNKDLDKEVTNALHMVLDNAIDMLEAK